jgi:anti-sigma factor RsiW
MNCRDWEERLALYAGGDLPHDEAVQVERHLGECPGCQMFASGLKESQELIQELHREPLAPAHFARVRAQVLAQLEREQRPFWRRGWAFGFAAVAVATLVMLAVRPAHKPVPRPPEVAVGHPPAPVLPEPASILGHATTVANRQQRPPRRFARAKAQPGEPVLIRMVSDDPDVVIYWIADTKGE